MNPVEQSAAAPGLFSLEYSLSHSVSLDCPKKVDLNHSTQFANVRKFFCNIGLSASWTADNMNFRHILTPR